MWGGALKCLADRTMLKARKITSAQEFIAKVQPETTKINLILATDQVHLRVNGDPPTIFENDKDEPVGGNIY